MKTGRTRPASGPRSGVSRGISASIAALGVLLTACGDSPPALVADTRCPVYPAAYVDRAGKIDVGGFGLYAEIQGRQVEGRPTVVFDHGAGESHAVWQRAGVQQTIAQGAMTLAYDRAGQGQSDESDLPKTAEEQSRQLHELLAHSGLPAPYLFVSHSIAGMNVRVYADRYPDEVAGVVFVDSSHEGINEGTWRPITMADVSSSGEMTYAEFEQTVEQVRDTRPRDALRHIPITVLSATCHGPCDDGTSVIDEEGWMEFQRDIATLSDDSRHVVAPPGSEHHLMTTQPRLVMDAVCDLLHR